MGNPNKEPLNPQQLREYELALTRLFVKAYDHRQDIRNHQIKLDEIDNQISILRAKINNELYTQALLFNKAALKKEKKRRIESDPIKEKN